MGGNGPAAGASPAGEQPAERSGAGPGAARPRAPVGIRLLRPPPGVPVPRGRAFGSGGMRRLSLRPSSAGCGLWKTALEQQESGYKRQETLNFVPWLLLERWPAVPRSAG